MACPAAHTTSHEDELTHVTKIQEENVLVSLVTKSQEENDQGGDMISSLEGYNVCNKVCYEQCK